MKKSQRNDQRQPISAPQKIEEIGRASFSQYLTSDYLAPYKFVPILASRRCYWGKCDFCAIPNAWDTTFRQRRPDDVVNDLAFYARQGTRFFRIVDEDFPPGLMRECVNLILQRGLDIRFEAYSRFEAAFLDPAFCRQLFAAGCRQLFFGLENIGAETAALVNKGSFYTEANISRCLANTAAAGIHNYLFILIGIPNAPVEEERLTTSYVIDNKNIHCMALGSFLVDRLSPIHVQPEIRAKYAIELQDVGDMTTEIGYLFRGKDIRDASKDRAFAYTKAIFSARPDLALTSLLDEETRCIMSDTFGNDFAVHLLNELTPAQLRSMLTQAEMRCADEKINRILSVRDDN